MERNYTCFWMCMFAFPHEYGVHNRLNRTARISAFGYLWLGVAVVILLVQGNRGCRVVVDREWLVRSAFWIADFTWEVC